MQRLVSGIVSFLLSSPLVAAVREADDAAAAPAETVGLVWVIVFVVIFFGMIGWFFWYLWLNEKKGRSEDGPAK